MTLEPDITGILWRANFPDFFLWAEWEDEEASVFFHQGSGETLLLNPLGAYLLKTICSEGISIEKLAHRTARYFDLPVDKALLGTINMSLRTFEQKGLVLSSVS
jgi:hypothetical protein